MGGQEVVDLVDLEDRVVGSATLAKCLEEGLLHRAVAVLVERSDGSVILQVRSKSDLWMPGMLTLSCTGHVKRGEEYEAGAGRELSEELGIGAQVKLVGKMLMPKIVQGDLTEWEWTALYAARSDERLAIDTKELEGVKEVSRAGLQLESKSPRMTDDARLLLARFVFRDPSTVAVL